jgi:hypothetical protein
MPRLATFRGATISIHWEDHPPPHVHASYGRASLVIGIDPVVILRGRLPRRVERRILRGVVVHHAELMEAWHDVEQGVRPKTITAEG